MFPRLVASEHHEGFSQEVASTGVAALDELLGGGIERGTSMLVMGPAGSGKSALVNQVACAAAARGEKAAVFTFDEGTGTLFARAEQLGMDLKGHVEADRVSVRQVDPAELSPGEFTHVVRQAVERQHARMIVIDTLNGYLQAMPDERSLTMQLHELLMFLRQRGVIALLVVAQRGLVGAPDAPIDVSYLADGVILTRYFEVRGRVRKAISVVKKRSGAHEDTVREFALGPKGMVVGPPLEHFRGVLTGLPVLDGGGPLGELLGSGHA